MAKKRGTIQSKRYTAAEWAVANPILADGEIGVLRDSKPRKFKIGDGITTWNELGFSGGGDPVDLTAVNADIAKKINTTAIGAPSGVAPLDAQGKIPSANLPSFVDEVKEFANKAAFPATGETDKIYTDIATGKVYRWGGSIYTEISPSEVVTVNGKKGAVTLTAADIGLGNVLNVAPKDLPVSDLTAAAIAAAVAGKIDLNTPNQPIEVELVPAVRQLGKISAVDGTLIASTADEHSGMIPVTPGEEILFTLRSNEVNASPPATYAGIAGYATNNRSSFITTKDAKGLPIGNIFDVNRFNAESSESVQGHVNFINQRRTIPAGVYFIDGSSLLETDGSGVVFSIKAIRNVGTLAQSLNQLFSKAGTEGAGSGGSVTKNEFTDAEKQKLAAIQMPTVPWLTKGIGTAQQFVGVDDGLNYLVYIRGGALVVEGNTKTLRNMPYRVGFSWDQDKEAAAYKAVVRLGQLFTPENGMTIGHLQPGLNAGFTQFVKGANSLKWDFEEADAICQEVIDLGTDAKVHGAHLTWHQVYNPLNPTGVNKQHVLDIITNNPGNEMQAITDYFEETIPYTIKHFETKFPGLVIGWNVMNEFLDETGKQIPSVFAPYFTLEQWTTMSFKAACGASLTCKFFMNGYNYETGNDTRIDTTIALINGLEAKNLVAPNGRPVKVDGIGSQMHAQLAIGERNTAESGYGIVAFRDKLAKLARTGKLIMISELDLGTSGTYNDALLARQAASYKAVFETYERAVPAAQRWGVVMWTVADKVFIDNVGKGYTGWDGAKPASNFPAMWDWNYVVKPALAAVLSLIDRPETYADVVQDFMILPDMTDIVTSGLNTAGLTPLPWKKAGYTTGNIGKNDTGLQAKQTSQNSRTTVYVDYPYPNRTVYFEFYNIAGTGNRTGMLFFKYVDENNSLRIQINNSTDTYSIISRSQSVDTTLWNSDTIKPTKGDKLRFTYVDGAINFFLNDVLTWSGTDAIFKSATKIGISLKGFDDKYTSIDRMWAHRI